MASGIGKFFGALFGESEPEVATSSEPRQEPALRGKTPPPMTPAREKLIRDAMAVTASKQHVLDRLDPKTREELAREALRKLGPAAGIGGPPKSRAT